MDVSPNALNKMYEEGWGSLGNWRDQWEEIALYTMPGKADFITQRSKGDRARTRRLYDSTALVSNHTLASHMHTAMTSPSAPWFTLAYRQPDLNRHDKAKEWAEDCTKRMMAAINDSNFVSVINELYQDLIAFGTACIDVSYTYDAQGFKLVFQNMSMGELVFHENVHGIVDTVQYKQKMKITDILLKWPDIALEAVLDRKDKPNDRLSLLRTICPNPDYDRSKELSENNRLYLSTWQYKDELIERKGYYENPYMVPRWSKMTNEPYGYGPGLLALPDIKTLNEAKRLELRSWEKAIDPPLLGMANGIIGDIHLEAGGYTQVRDTRALVPLADAANWQATQIKTQELRQSIQTVYLIDQLILPERPNATATEVQIRYEMMQRVLGPTMGRLQAELLNPLVERVFGLMFRNNQLAESPEEVSEADAEIQYTGPLAKAQTANEALAIERMINALMALGDMAAEAADAMDMPKAMLALAHQWGVPASVLRSEDEIEELQMQRQQAMQQQENMQGEMQQAEIAKTQNEASGAEVNAMKLLREV